MSSTLRRFAGTASLTLAASVLTLPCAVTASATPTQTTFLVADTNSDGSYGLYTMDTPTGSETALPGVAESPLRDIYQLSAARTGGRIAYVLDTYASVTATTPSNEQIVVRDKSGLLVRVIASISPSAGGLFSPAISPDGNSVVFNEVTDAGVTLRKADVGTGVTSILSTAVVDTSFADADTLFGFTATARHAVALPAAGGSTIPLNIPDAASEIRVAPAGGYVAWSLDKSTVQGTTVSDVQFATLDLSTNTVGTASTLASGGNNHSPSWETSAFEYVHDDGAGGPGDVHQLQPSNPQATDVPVGATSSIDEQEIAILEPVDSTAPTVAPATDASFTLNGTSATIRWSLPTDTDGDRSGVVITRTGRIPFYEPEGVTSVVDTGLVLGQRYDYTITAIDRSGNQSVTGATRSLLALQAKPSFSDPTSSSSTQLPFPVTFGPTSSGRYTVDFRYAGGQATWSHWVIDTAGRVRTFGTAGSGNVRGTTSSLGFSYIFRVQVVDSFGNTSPIVSSTRAVVPRDDKNASISGGTRAYAASAFLGSYQRQWAPNHFMWISLYGNRLQIVGMRCRSCGSFDVFDGNTRIATVSSYLNGNAVFRAVLYTKSYSTVGSHTFTIEPRGTAGHPYVMIDAFAMRQ